MAKTREPRETFPVDAEYLAKFANRLEYVGRRYREIAQTLGDQEIRVTGRPTAERAEGLLRGWMSTLQSAADDLAMGMEIELTPPPEPTSAEMNAALHKAQNGVKPPPETPPKTPRRKKKGA